MKTLELIIPIRMDAGKATAALTIVGATRKRAGDYDEPGTKKAQRGLLGAAQAASDFGQKTVAIQGMQLALAAVGGAVGAMTPGFKEAVDYITNIAKEFVDLRQAMQQVAALKGEPNINEFTVKESEKAFAASLKPQEWRSFQEQFQSYGGAYLEGDQARFVDKEINGKKVTDAEQGEQYQQKIAEFAKARGIPADEIAQLGGALLQFSDGPQDVETLMSQLGKVYKTLERAPTPLAKLMPAMSRVMAQSASPEEASRMLAIMSEAMPHEEETGVIKTLKAITNETLEGRGAALGQTEDMTPLEKIKAALKSIKDRVDNGEKLDAIVHKIAPDLREAKGIKGFLSRGLEAQGFKRTEGYQEQTPTDFVDQSIADYEKSDTGRHAKAVAERSLAQARAGVSHAELEMLKEQALARMTERRDFEMFKLPEFAVKGAIGLATGVGVRQQRINTEMLTDVGRRAADAGIETDISPNLAYRRAEIATESAEQDQITINKRIADLLEKIEANTKKDKDAGTQPAAEPGKPLTAKPPPGAGARQ